MHKTTFKVRKQKWELFNQECKAASIRRDDFLNRALTAEIDILESIPACDSEGAHWLKKTWVEHGPRNDRELLPVPVLLSSEVIARLNAVCSMKGVPRDAFFDCALTFFTERLYESVIVIKNPRTTKDLVSQVASIANDPNDELTDSDRRRFLADTCQEWWAHHDLVSMRDDYYKERVSFDKGRTEHEKALLEL